MSGNKLVLCVDDSRVSRIKLRQLILQKHPDWRVVEAGSGEEGLQVAAQAAPDLITVDINMPGMGGLAAVEQLRALYPQTKIILLSGNIQDSSKRKALELGAGFVEKPITETSITKVIACIEN